MFRKSIVRKNLILTLVFGIIMGIVFPIFASFFVIYKDEKSKLIFTVLSIFAGIFVGVTAFIITKNTIIKIISILQRDMSLITSGRVDTIKGLELESDDSIGLLVNEFNTFIISANKMSSILKQIITRDEEISNNMEITYQKTVENGEIIDKSFKNTLRIIQSNTKSVDSATMLTKSINSNTNNLFNLIKSQKNNMELTINGIYSILESIDETEKINLKHVDELKNITSTLNNSRSMMDKIDNSFLSIQNDTSKISDITKKIHEISDKTNILAINASIEASHAGKGGEGFKVIASEVRKLAENTSKYADDITSNINSMVLNVNKTVEISNQSKSSMFDLKKIVENFNSDHINITNCINDIKKKGNLILDIANEVNRNEEDVLSSSLKINKSVEEINLEMNKVLDRSNKTYSSIDGVLKSLDNSLDDFEEVKTISSQNKRDLSLSKREMGIFKLKPGL